jgi:LCP family protein required for cell wall assembly
VPIAERADEQHPAPRATRLQRAARLRRRFYLLTGLSTVIPGAGLLLTRSRALGVLLAVPTVLGAVTLLSLWARGGLVKAGLALAVSPGLLTLVIVGAVLLALVWAGAILVTAGQTRPSDGQGRVVRPVFVLGCCAVVVVPVGIATRDLTVQRSVVTTIFPSVVSVGSTPIATSQSDDPWAGTPRVNLLLLGSDAGTDRIGVRTDSMMVASINTKTGDTVLLGLPRNLENAPIPKNNPLSALYPNGYNCGDQCLLNGIWTLATDHKDLFPTDPNPGLTSTREVISEILGEPIQRSVVIDLRGFEDLVNAIGGVDINVQERVCAGCKSNGYGGIIWSGGKVQWIEKGMHHLTGYQALWYARSRATSDDFSRMRRQRCVAGALVSQVDAATMVAHYAALAAALKHNLSTDITQDELSAWVELVSRIQHGTIRSLPITDKVVRVGNPDYAKIRSLVKDALSATKAKASTGPAAAATSSGGATPSPTPTVDDTLTSLTASC